MKTARENEERQKARIEALTKQVADERQAKEETERQLTVKLKALTFAEKKLERVDQMMTEAKATASKREIALQQSVDAKSVQLEQLNSLCASQKNRLDVLTQEMEGRGVEFASKVAAAEARNAEVTAAQNVLKGEIKKLTQELEAARMADLEARQRNDEQLQQKEAELREAKSKFDRDIAKLEQAVAAIQSGRGRLEQLQELQAEHAKKEQEFQEKIAELTEQVDSLSAENEALAESNAAMVAAMEGAGAEVKEALGSRMDTKGWEERVQKLEGESAKLRETVSSLEQAKEALEGQMEGLKKELAQKVNAISDLDAKLKVALGDAQFKGEALETTQKTMNSMIAETKAKVCLAKSLFVCFIYFFFFLGCRTKCGYCRLVCPPDRGSPHYGRDETSHRRN